MDSHSRTTPPQTREWVVYDEYSPCPYLPGQIARMPLRLPVEPLSRAQLSQRLEAGDRRQGALLYRPRCPGCQACQAIRLPVREFVPNRTQRRIFRRGNQLLETRVALPVVDAERVRLYNRHKVERRLLTADGLIDRQLYEEFLVDTCAETFELSYWLDGRLVGVAITDRAADALSAVYCYYDPCLARLSIGTYSILKQLELCRAWGLAYLYLGLYVEGCATMAYKARFLPHERLIHGRWRRFSS
ncbi:MAG: putative arginyl-tRNA--protein transferase [Candidatus Binatia bacterium]|nr:MAG: putative arginyl-tRNA--protein transferase [Candidatus Binatia bacterium]